MAHREVLGSVPLLDSKILEAEKALRLVCFWGLEPCPLLSCSRGSCHSHMAPILPKPSHTDLGKLPPGSVYCASASGAEGPRASAEVAGWPPSAWCLARQPSGETRAPSPGAHGPLGAAWPASAQKSPGGQGRHQLTSGAPLPAFQVPKGQGLCLGFLVPAGQKWPGGQRSPKGSLSWRKRGLSRLKSPEQDGCLSQVPS